MRVKRLEVREIGKKKEIENIKKGKRHNKIGKEEEKDREEKITNRKERKQEKKGRRIKSGKKREPKDKDEKKR